MADTPKTWSDPEYDPRIHGLVFKPAPDITAYELARIITKIDPITQIVCPTEAESWPRELQRHWRQIK